jgi:hypothetical protein
MTLLLAIFLSVLLVLWTLFWIMVARDETKKAMHLLGMPRLNRPFREDVRGEPEAPFHRESPADHVLGVVVSLFFIATASWAAYAIWKLYAMGAA